jgi:hypothetical protein
MCKCEQKEKLPKKLGYWDYVFLCKKANGKNRVITIIDGTNDSQAKQLAEQKCLEEEKSS